MPVPFKRVSVSSSVCAFAVISVFAVGSVAVTTKAIGQRTIPSPSTMAPVANPPAPSQHQPAGATIEVCEWFIRHGAIVPALMGHCWINQGVPLGAPCQCPNVVKAGGCGDGHAGCGEVVISQ
jgi:hypothetical protein